MAILQYFTKSRIQPFKYFINTNFVLPWQYYSKEFLKQRIYFIIILSSDFILKSLSLFQKLSGLAVMTCNMFTYCKELSNLVRSKHFKNDVL